MFVCGYWFVDCVGWNCSIVFVDDLYWVGVLFVKKVEYVVIGVEFVVCLVNCWWLCFKVVVICGLMVVWELY